MRMCVYVTHENLDICTANFPALYACVWEEKEAKERTRETWSKAEIAELEMPDTSSLAQFMIDGYILATATLPKSQHLPKSPMPKFTRVHVCVYMYTDAYMYTCICMRAHTSASPLPSHQCHSLHLHAHAYALCIFSIYLSG